MHARFARRLGLGAGVLAAGACLVACDPAAEEDAAAAGAAAGGAPVVNVDTNRRVVMEMTTGLPGSTAFDQGDVSLTRAALTDGPGGTITTQLSLCATGVPQATNVLQCTVTPGFVVTGGGAWAAYSGPGGGALITASYPFDSALTKWEARSKEHGSSHPHILYSYVIGMRLNGINTDALRANMTLTTKTSTQNAHPHVEVLGPADELVVGGGAKINYTGAGSLLITSMPSIACQQPGGECSGWVVTGKDHVVSDPATITGYAITIKRNIFQFGTVNVKWDYATTPSVATGVSTATYQVPVDYALTGLGGSAFNEGSGPGRMLVRIGPNPDLGGGRALMFQDKDHLEIDDGHVLGDIMMIRRLGP